MGNLPTRDQLQDDPFEFRDEYRDYQRPRQSFTDAAFPSAGEYGQQVDTYDAGRPTTMTEDKIGNRVVPNGGQAFDPSYDAKVQSLAMVRGRQGEMPTMAGAYQNANRAPLSYRGDALAALAEAKRPENVVRDIRLGQSQAQSIAANPARRMGMTGDAAMLVSDADTQNRASGRAPLPLSVSTKDIGAGPLAAPSPMAQQPSALQGGPDEKAGQATASPNAWKGNYAASDANGQGIYQDPKTGAISIRLTGDKGRDFMASQVPTARPGGTLSVAQAPEGKYGKRPDGTNKGIGFFLNEELNAAQAALNAKRDKVAAIERANPGQSGYGSRDYISPYLSDEQARARQAEIYEQRAKDQLAAAMGAQTSRATRALADPTTSDADRKTAREWLAMMDKREQFLRGDDTTRRDQDMSMADNAADSDNRERVEAWKQEMDARENEADRQTQLQTAEIQSGARAKDTPQEKARSAAIEAYFKAVGDPMNQKSPDDLLAMYGLRKEDISMPVDRASVIQGAKGAPGTRK